LKEEVGKIRDKESEIRSWTADQFESNRRFVVDKVNQIIGLRNAKKADAGKA
jgi:hypothetical protein